MKEIVTTMTQRGQVTVPSEVRRLLSLKPRDKVAFSIAGDRVEILAAKFTLRSIRGAVKPLGNEADFKDVIREAKEDKLRRDADKLP